MATKPLIFLILLLLPSTSHHSSSSSSFSHDEEEEIAPIRREGGGGGTERKKREPVVDDVVVDEATAKQVVLAGVTEELRAPRSRVVECVRPDTPFVPNCSPQECKRVVMDGQITPDEIVVLRRLAESGFKFGGGSGPPSIFDLSSGALSHESKFINLFASISKEKIATNFPQEDIAIYKSVLARIKSLIQSTFAVSTIHHVGPNFFSRINGSMTAMTMHDEYWHWHVDRLQYRNFEFTVLLYLSDHDTDFSGGEFAFESKEGGQDVIEVVQPKRGRLLMFSSGKENPHRVKPVTGGVRWALTIAFTCDESVALGERQLTVI